MQLSESEREAYERGMDITAQISLMVISDERFRDEDYHNAFVTALIEYGEFVRDNKTPHILMQIVGEQTSH